jgi:hypothetical protein
MSFYLDRVLNLYMMNLLVDHFETAIQIFLPRFDLKQTSPFDLGGIGWNRTPG